MKQRLSHLLLVVLILAMVGCSSAQPRVNPTATATYPVETPAPARQTTVADTPMLVEPTNVVEPAATAKLPEPTGAPPATTTPFPTATPLPTATALPTATIARPAPAQAPFDLLSEGSLLAFVSDLTAIQPHSGWRNSASQGEAEALDYVARRLNELSYLQDLGLEIERQSFPVYLATELWETGLELTVDGQFYSVPADGLRGPRNTIQGALLFDSDGKLNDAQRNPLGVSGPVVLVHSDQDLADLRSGGLEGKLALLNYALVDYSYQDRGGCIQRARDLLALNPAGIVAVTQNSNKLGESHGSFIGDGGVFNLIQNPNRVPVLSVRLEDLAVAGLAGWEDLANIQSAQMIWDADVFSPAQSGNLVARIPGVDPSQAMILGAHIDSPNNPGAMDDGSGSAVLFEVARVLNQARVQPPVDLYLAWFGSEELLVQGSAYFASTHQELLDRTLAVLTVDDLTHPLDEAHSELSLYTWSSFRVNLGDPLFAEYLSSSADRRGVHTLVKDRFHLYSDNSVFGGFGVPNADLILTDETLASRYSDHYIGHIHDPYDTVELASEMGEEFVQMAQVALSAALDIPYQAPDLRQPFPPPTYRAVFLANHNQYPSMSPVTYAEFGMALAQQGFDVDLLPYGQPLTGADLQNARLVVALPVCDYPGPEAGTTSLYDTGWSPAEIDILQAYVQDGGFLVLANSAYCTDMLNQPQGENEDVEKANALAQRFGITYLDKDLADALARPAVEHPLLQAVANLSMVEHNASPIEAPQGLVLAETRLSQPVMVLVEVGPNGGQVLALGDSAMLGPVRGQADNLPFWTNLANYAARR